MFTKEKPVAVGCEVIGRIENTWDKSEFLRIPDPPAR